MSSSAVRNETIQALRRKLVSSQKNASGQKTVPTGLRALDSLLPGGGLPTASLIEWISDDAGQAAASIALRSLRPMLALPGCLAVIDERHEFHADAARAQGLPLSRILLIRPHQQPPADASASGRSRFVRRTSLSHGEALWALEQSARCPGVRIVLGWLDRSSATVMRRLQLAVERSGVNIVLIRPASVLSQASFADLRLYVQPVAVPLNAATMNAATAHAAANSNHGSTGLSGNCDPSRASGTSRMRVQQERLFSVRLLRSRHGLQHDGVARLHQLPWEEQVCSV